jgi:hypothetical protein
LASRQLPRAIQEGQTGALRAGAWRVFPGGPPRRAAGLLQPLSHPLGQFSLTLRLPLERPHLDLRVVRGMPCWRPKPVGQICDCFKKQRVASARPVRASAGSTPPSRDTGRLIGPSGLDQCTGHHPGRGHSAWPPPPPGPRFRQGRICGV